MVDVNGIPVDTKEVPCRFGCGDIAVGHFSTPNGCVCFPDDVEQDLCVQHALTAEPHGAFTLVTIYHIGLYELLTST